MRKISVVWCGFILKTTKLRKLLTTLFLLNLLVPNAWAACANNDEACFHNIIRDALSFGQTLNNLGANLNQNYNFALENRPATRLPLLSNSGGLRTSAAVHAAKCAFSHSGEPGVGENLFVGTGSSWTEENAVNAWADEVRYMNYPKNAATVSCQAGEQCGHYTQMVWETTTQVGCAVQFCANGISGFNPNPSTNIVCQYSPPGNFINASGQTFAPFVGLGVQSSGNPPPASGSALIVPILLLLLND